MLCPKSKKGWNTHFPKQTKKENVFCLAICAVFVAHDYASQLAAAMFFVYIFS